MLVKTNPNSRQRQRGMTLIELMISIVLGLLILSAATAMTVKSLAMNTETLASARLNQELDSIIHVMVNDIRRAGYSGGLFDFADNEDLNIVSSSCVLYAYDANENGALDNTEKLGFKLVNSEVQMRTDCAAGATCATDCTTGTWSALNETDMTTITSLTFDAVDSKCISLTDPGNVVEPGGVNPTNKNNFWVTTVDDTLQFPCLASTGTNLTTHVLNTSDIYVSGTFVAPQSGDRLIGSRQVNIAVQGRLTGDATMVKQQNVGINVRNPHIRTIP